jgi:hypothetical protein
MLISYCARRNCALRLLGRFQAGGALIGPHALGIIKDVEAVRHLAELGVVFLLFNIGLELSLERLRQMQKYVFGLGSAQVSSWIYTKQMSQKQMCELVLTILHEPSSERSSLDDDVMPQGTPYAPMLQRDSHAPRPPLDTWLTGLFEYATVLDAHCQYSGPLRRLLQRWQWWRIQ